MVQTLFISQNKTALALPNGSGPCFFCDSCKLTCMFLELDNFVAKTFAYIYMYMYL